jgi:curved DNA-binding protein
VPEAVDGAEITLPTFEGPVRFRIPANSQAGKKIRLRGKGLPDLRGAPRGDLYAVVRIVLPEPSEKLEKAARAFEPLYDGDPRASISL